MSEMGLSPARILDFVRKLSITAWELRNSEDVDTGRTRRIALHKLGPTTLCLYPARETAGKTAPALFLVPSLINKSVIFDLIPDRSFINYLTGRGMNVFLLDWGEPRDEDASISFEEYLFDYYRGALKAALEHTGRDALPIMGYCIGGTLSMVHAGLFPENVSCLINLASPVDFHRGGILRKWIDESGIDIAKLTRACGNVPPAFMYQVFSMLKPTGRLTAFRVFYQRREDQAFREFHRAIDHWTADNIAFPGAFARTYIKDFYHGNGLKNGNLVYRGRRVNLREYRNAFLNILSTVDHIVPPSAARLDEDFIGAKPHDTWEFDRAGHVGLLVGAKNSKELWPKLHDWLLEHGA